eukprot:2090439-Amphidinium_carterae.1
MIAVRVSFGDRLPQQLGSETLEFTKLSPTNSRQTNSILIGFTVAHCKDQADQQAGAASMTIPTSCPRSSMRRSTAATL